MAYSVSFHMQTIKAKAKPEIFMVVAEHADRKAYDQTRLERGLDTPQRANENIDASLTAMNKGWFLDENGDWKESVTATDAYDSILRRLDEAKGVRTNSVGVNTLVMQLDPDFFKDAGLERGTQEWAAEAERTGEMMIDWAKRTFGVENVRAAQLHLDESNPHIHLQMVPVRPDSGKLSNDFFFGSAVWGDPNGKHIGGRGKLVWYHNSLRKTLTAQGLDISMERKTNKRVEERFESRLTEEQMRDLDRVKEAWKQRAETVSQLDSRAEAYNRAEKALKEHVKAVEARLDKRAAQVDQTVDRALRRAAKPMREDLKRRGSQLDEREAQLNAREARVSQREQDVKERERELDIRATDMQDEAQNNRVMLNSIFQSVKKQQADLEEEKKKAAQLVKKAHLDYQKLSEAIDDMKDAALVVSRIDAAKQAAARSVDMSAYDVDKTGQKEYH